MIKVAIHGTIGGFKLIYGEQRLFSDPNADTTNWQAIGQTAYSLMFLNNSCVFSKYKIIRDVIGDKRQGSIAFSVIISDKLKKLSGADIKSLIDRIYVEFHKIFIDGNNLGNVRENWSFINDIVAHYEDKLIDNSNVVEMQSGTQEPAVIYYNDEIELQEYFDKPYQDEYNSFKQIYLISNGLKSKEENPLNSLRNSGVELNDIDLRNEPFFLNNYNHSKGVKISAYYKNKWNERSDRKGENQIRAKWQIEIKYARDYYKPIVATGSISNIASEIHKYLEKNGNNIKIKYDAFQPEPETKTISFYVVTKKDGAKVTDAEIQIGDYQNWQRISENTFKAEELGKEYRIKARKGDNLFSDVVKITPKDLFEATVPLQLIEKRVVKITATDQDNGDAIWQFKVHITGKDFFKITDQIEFVGDEIDKVWNIQIEKRKQYADSENIKFCPARDGNEINFKLKKAKTQPIGLRKVGDRSDVSGDKGEKQKCVFSRITPKKWGFIAVGIILLSIGTWALYSLFVKDEQTSLNKWEIELYVEGDSLMLEKLHVYKENWEKQEQDFITKSGKGLFGGHENIDSSKWKSDWKPAYDSIEKAIKKRELINDKNIAELRNQHYSIEQLFFKNAIEEIDSTKYTEVGEELGDVSYLTLTQIADRINKMIQQGQNNDIQDTIANNSSPDNLTTGAQKSIPNNSGANSKSSTESKTGSNAPVTGSSRNDKQAEDNKLQDEFEKAFWSIVHKNTTPSKGDFENWFNGGSSISSNNIYKKFYDEHLSKSQEFNKFQAFFKIPAQNRKMVKSLEALKKMKSP